jgi:hypothetical protein
VYSNTGWPAIPSGPHLLGIWGWPPANFFRAWVLDPFPHYLRKGVQGFLRHGAGTVGPEWTGSSGWERPGSACFAGYGGHERGLAGFHRGQGLAIEPGTGLDQAGRHQFQPVEEAGDLVP